jgi:hypothetical protein
MNVAQLFAYVGINMAQAQQALNSFKGLLANTGQALKYTFQTAGASVQGLLSPLGMVEKGLRGFMKVLYTVTGPLFIFKIIKNDLEDLAAFMSKAEVATWQLKSAFGSTFSDYVNWSKLMQQATGVSAYTFDQGIVRLRSLAQNYGLTTEQIKLLATATMDLGEVMGVDIDERFPRIESAIRGEAEAAERLGLNLQDNYMKHQAFGGVLNEVWQDLTESEKAQFRYIEALNQAKFAAGKAGEATQIGTAGYRMFTATLQEAAGVLWNAFKPAVAESGLVLAGFGKMLLDWAKKIADAYGDGGIGAVFKMMPEWIRSIVAIAQIIIGPILGAINSVWQTLQPALGGIWASIVNLIKAVEPVWQSFWQLMSTIVNDFITYVLPYILEFVDKVATIFRVAWPMIAQIVQATWNVIVTIVVNALDIIWPIISGALDFIINIFKAFSALLKGDWKKFFSYLGQAALSALKGIAGFFAKAFELIMNVVIGSITWIIDKLGKLVGFFNKDWGNSISGFAKNLAEGAKIVTNAIDGWFDTPKAEEEAEDAGRKTGSSLADGFKSMWDKAKEAGKGTMVNYADGLKSFDADSAFKSVFAKVNDRLKETPEAAKKAFEKLKDYFSELTEALAMEVFRADTLWEIWKASFKGAEESPEYLAAKLQNLQTKLKSMQDTLPEYKQLWLEAKDALGANTDEVERLEKEYLNLQKSIAETSREIETLTDKIVDQTKKDAAKDIDALMEAIVDALRARYEAEKKLALDTKQADIDAEKERHETKMDDLEKEYKAEKKAIEQKYAKDAPDRKGRDDRIDAIDREIELMRRAEQDKQELNDIEELKNQIKYEQMWGDAKKAAELQKKLDETESKRQMRLKIDQLEDEKNGLKKENDLAEDAKDKELERLEEEYEKKKETEEKKYKETSKRLEKEQKALEDDYAKKLEDANLHAQAIKLIEDNNMKEILELLNKYGDQWKVLGKSYGERMVEGIKTADPLIDQWVNDIMTKIGQVTSPEGFNKIIIDKLNAYISDLQAQWESLSDNGAPSSDPNKKAQQDALHATAEAVRKIIASLGGTAIPAYDKGGPILQDQTARIHGGEWVLTSRNVGAISDWLNSLEDTDNRTAGMTAMMEALVKVDKMEVRSDDDIRKIAQELRGLIGDKLTILGTGLRTR